MINQDKFQSPAVDLYELLPAIHRIRDAQQGYPLRAFLEVIGGQVDIVKRDIDQLWDDLFIETCRQWVIPYIGDLVGNIPIHEVGQRRRTDVAKTIFYRRRKGTLTMLQQLAHDVTGWSAHAVAMFEQLAWTQNMNHLRGKPAAQSIRQVAGAVDSVATAHVRHVDVMNRVDGPFDVSAHTVDVRRIGQQEGWHNLRNVGFFLWRLQNYPLSPRRHPSGDSWVGVTPKRAADPHLHGFHFRPLGNPAPLMHKPHLMADEFQLVDEKHVRGPIRPISFHHHPSDYYGIEKSFAIFRDGNLVTLPEIICAQLDKWAKPPSGKVAVDVWLGRFTFAPGEVPDEVTVYYNEGFSADIGGGPYHADLMELQADNVWIKSVAKSGAGDYTSLLDALADWADPNGGNKADAVITILDSATYEETISIEPREVSESGQRSELVIQAGRLQRPHIKLDDIFRVIGSHPDASLSLRGLLIEGQIELSDSLGALNLVHCTLVPGVSLNELGRPVQPDRPSLVAAPSNHSLVVHVDSCITGALQLPSEMPDLTVTDSIIDGGQLPAVAGPSTSGPPTTMQRVTVFGKVLVKELKLASEVIFVDPVIAQRTQAGCVRFSYLPDQPSQTPQRYRCQPDMALGGVTCSEAQAIIRTRLRPSFTSDRYGDPAYGQLHLNSPSEIRTGAEDGSEMGAFEQLKQPHREANLRIRLEEYLPFGLEAGLIYVT